MIKKELRTIDLIKSALLANLVKINRLILPCASLSLHLKFCSLFMLRSMEDRRTCLIVSNIGKSKHLGSKYRHRKDSLLRKSKQKFSSCAKISKGGTSIIPGLASEKAGLDHSELSKSKQKPSLREDAYNTIETRESTGKLLRRDRNRTENRKKRKSRVKSKSKSRKRLHNDYTQISSELHDYRSTSMTSGKKYKRGEKHQGSSKYSNMESTTSIRVKHRYIGKDHLMNSHRSHSEDSGGKNKYEKARIKPNASDISKGSKLSRHNNDKRRKSNSRERSKRKKSESENQLIYTFRENNEEVDHEALNTIQHTSKGSNLQKIKEPPVIDKFSTITRNDKIFEKTLMTINNSKKSFYNTGKCIENISPSDLNILKGYKDKPHLNTLEHSGSKTRTNYHRQSSKENSARAGTERRDCGRNKSKRPHINPEDIGLEENTKGYLAYMELFKKYNKLKRLFKKKARNERMLQEKVSYLTDKNQAYSRKAKKLQDMLRKCECAREAEFS
ncbi:unnamed protein product [Moneuplotes crassus]|uniref:Uncharacterized protein n=1 Tax=Euplotes crassus TaxID=5936 RepID=A0AAD2D6A3_EUPCR|nr:unnamed protein product [Moneuplotes crassus]